jgi:hypothetical protein
VESDAALLNALLRASSEIAFSWHPLAVLLLVNALSVVMSPTFAKSLSPAPDRTTVQLFGD